MRLRGRKKEKKRKEIEKFLHWVEVFATVMVSLLYIEKGDLDSPYDDRVEEHTGRQHRPKYVRYAIGRWGFASWDGRHIVACKWQCIYKFELEFVQDYQRKGRGKGKGKRAGDLLRFHYHFNKLQALLRCIAYAICIFSFTLLIARGRGQRWGGEGARGHGHLNAKITENSIWPRARPALMQIACNCSMQHGPSQRAICSSC